ncbi:hypothetical protein H0H81_007905 [Sphagnurus paluster]|uniref:GST N-terminal domain-containing protein n=1 Tax=Sphagnurus paluster TaxID=117069 RepID=A0A9P7G1Y2_9AGAR|nr:hypothetical protein H0H81_007905 [Sphagnurus paluster]
MSSSNKPFILYTAATPNGFQASVFLEELKAIYPSIEYDIEKIDISKNVQKARISSRSSIIGILTGPQEPWFIKLNPNGRIPVLVDQSRDNFPVFETAAILLYLAHNYDKDQKFWYDPITHPKEYSEILHMVALAPCKDKVGTHVLCIWTVSPDAYTQQTISTASRLRIFPTPKRVSIFPQALLQRVYNFAQVILKKRKDFTEFSKSALQTVIIS